VSDEAGKRGPRGPAEALDHRRIGASAVILAGTTSADIGRRLGEAIGEVGLVAPLAVIGPCADATLAQN